MAAGRCLVNEQIQSKNENRVKQILFKTLGQRNPILPPDRKRRIDQLGQLYHWVEWEGLEWGCVLNLTCGLIGALRYTICIVCEREA